MCTLGRGNPRAETGLQKVPAGWRFPVEHLSGHEHARQVAQTEVVIHFKAGDATGRRDSPVDRCWAQQFQRKRFQVRGLGRGPDLMRQRDGDRRESDSFQGRRERVTLAAFGQSRCQHFLREIGMQIEPKDCRAVTSHGSADGSAKRVDGTALNAIVANHRLASYRLPVTRHADILERHPRKATAEMFGPVNDKSGVGWRERRDLDTGAADDVHPCSGRTHPRPARAAERQDRGIGPSRELALGCRETEFACTRPAKPLMPDPGCHTKCTKAYKPRAQQRRRPKHNRKHPTARTHERILAQPQRPRSECFGGKRSQRRGEPVRRWAVALDELLEWFTVGQIQTAAAGQQELATNRRHSVVHRHAHAGSCQRFGRHQPRRSPAQHRDRGRRVHLTILMCDDPSEVRGGPSRWR